MCLESVIANLPHVAPPAQEALEDHPLRSATPMPPSPSSPDTDISEGPRQMHTGGDRPLPHNWKTYQMGNIRKQNFHEKWHRPRVLVSPAGLGWTEEHSSKKPPVLSGLPGKGLAFGKEWESPKPHEEGKGPSPLILPRKHIQNQEKLTYSLSFHKFHVI